MEGVRVEAPYVRPSLPFPNNGYGAWGSAIAPPAGAGRALPPNAFRAIRSPKCANLLMLMMSFDDALTRANFSFVYFLQFYLLKFFDIFQWGEFEFPNPPLATPLTHNIR